MNGLWWEQCRKIRLEVFANLQNYQDPNVLCIFTSENILFDEIKFFRRCLWWQTFLDITSMGNSWISFAWPKTMNNIILQQRILLSVGKPSGSRKTIPFFSLLTSKTFYPWFEKNCFFNRDFQLLLKKVENKMNIVNCLDLEMIKTLQNWLLIFDDSCEEIYQEKDFEKIAVSGRHRGIHSIFVKHNLFQQNRWSRTIDLNTTRIFLFNSPRDSQQIEISGKQLNKINFLKECYTKAVAEPHSHLLIDLGTVTSDCLKFCLNLVGPEPTTFYLPSSQAKITEINN